MHVRRVVALALAIAFLAPSAAAGSEARGVGSFLVDASGQARGSNLAAVVTEASGRISAFTDVARGTRVLDGFSVDGFRAVSKLQGVGSSELLLRGDRADLALHDARQTQMVLEARERTVARADLADSVAARVAPDGRSAALTDRSGERLGRFLLAGPGELAESHGQLVADVHAGARLVWRGDTPGAPAGFDDAVAEAILRGDLASEVVTEFASGRPVQTVVRYADEARVDLEAVPGGLVARVSGSAALAFDLAYETVPAADPSEVAVFVDGLPVPAEVAVEDGRVLVLADLGDAGVHRVAVGVASGGGSERQARVEGGAEHDAAIGGSFRLHAGARLAGSFVAARADGSDLRDVTLVRLRQALFDEISLGAGPARLHADGRTFTMEGRDATLVLLDDAWATTFVDARTPTTVALELSEGLAARERGPRALVLEGSRGTAGALAIVLSDGTRADRSGFAVVGDGSVVATLEEGARLVFRAEPESRPTAGAVAEAVASGTLAGAVALGYESAVVSAASTPWLATSTLDVVSAEKGRAVLRFSDPSARAFLLETRGGTLAAKTAADVVVRVNGEAAPIRATAEEALASDGPAYAVDTSRSGDPRVLVHAGEAASSGAEVVVESALEAAARGAREADAFGAFRVFYDGTAVGSFVSFRTDAAAGVLADYTMIATGRRVFTSVAPGDSPFASAGGEGSSRILLENRETTVEASDVTGGFLKVVAREAAAVRWNLDSAVRAGSLAANVVALESAGGLVGSLVLTDVEGREARGSTLAVEEGAVVAYLQAGAQAIFRTHVGIENELTDAQRALVSEAVARGAVAGHVVAQTETSLAADATATSAAVNAYYEDVQILAAATRDVLELTVSSTTASGRTLIVSLDPETIPGMAEGHASILVDGEAVAHASSYADVLDPSDDGGDAEYFVLAGEAGSQVLVSIPHFSTRSVTLKDQSAFASPPVFMWATIFLSVLVALETVFLVRRRGK